MAAEANHTRQLTATRRALLGGALALPLLDLTSARAAPPASRLTFASVAATNADTVTVPPGYRVQTLIAWGDALFDDVPAFNPDTVRRADQELRFGQNNDMLALFPAQYSFPFDPSSKRLLLCANHEYIDPALLYPGLARAADMTPAHWEAAYAATGCSVVELEVSANGWKVIRNVAPGAGRNRRITPFSPVLFSGPAKTHRWIKAASAGFNAAEPAGAGAVDGEVRCGTTANCAGGRTPWGTYLTSEENFDGFFSLSDAKAPALTEAQADQAWIYDAGKFGYPLYSGGAARGLSPPRQFDVASNPYGPALFGWVVEIDPYDPDWTPRKRTALGRKKGECANTAIAKDGRVCVYMGDDQIDEFIYKFISAGRFDPADRTANRDLLDHGQLYVARFNEDGSGDWLAITLESANKAVADAPYHARFEDEGDLVVRVREAALLLGATPMDRPEDFEALIDDYWVGRGVVLVNCTYNRNEEFYRPGNPRRGEAQTRHVQQANVGGHILRLDEHDNDCGATAFQWGVFALAGDPHATSGFMLPGAIAADVSVTIKGAPTFSGDRFSCPDNLCFDTSDNVWIATDGSYAVFADCNDCVMAAPVVAARPPVVKRFLVGPVGAEICGPTFSLDERAFLCAIQHPGENDKAGASIAELRWRHKQDPPSTWPDGKWPRSAVVVVTRTDGDTIGV